VKILTIVFLILFSVQAFAKEKFYISNKLEVGYGKAFVSNQVNFDGEEFLKNSLTAGFKFKISDTAGFKTFYLLENTLNNSWVNNHFLGAQLELKIK